MSQQELIGKLNKSETDIIQGKLISQFEVKEYFKIINSKIITKKT
jgi:hypothetical protein